MSDQSGALATIDALLAARKGLDPRVKLAMLLAASTCAFAAGSISLLLLLLCIVCSAMVFAGLSGSELSKRSRGLISVLAFVTLLQALLLNRDSGGFLFTIPGSVPVAGGVGLVAREGLRQAIMVAMRFIVLLWTSALFSYTTTHGELLSGLRRLGLPYEICLVTDIAAGLLPSINMSFRQLAEVQRARGMNPTRNPVKNLHRLAVLLKPMVISQLLGGRNLAMALHSKGFRPGAERTSLSRIEMSGNDWAVLAATIVMTGCFIALSLHDPSGSNWLLAI